MCPLIFIYFLYNIYVFSFNLSFIFVLDSHTEASIISSLNAMSSNRTSLVIAHRLSTLSLSISIYLSVIPSLSFSLSLIHTHMNTHTHFLFFINTHQTHTLSLIHTHTHTHSHSLSLRYYNECR